MDDDKKTNEEEQTEGVFDDNKYTEGMLAVDIGPLLVEALGLPRDTTRFELVADAKSNGPVTVKCTYLLFPPKPEAEKVREAIKHYRLVPVKGNEDV